MGGERVGTEPIERVRRRGIFFFFFFEKDEITGQLAILLKICQVSRGPIRDLSPGKRKKKLFSCPSPPLFPDGPFLRFNYSHSSSLRMI